MIEVQQITRLPHGYAIISSEDKVELASAERKERVWRGLAGHAQARVVVWRVPHHVVGRLVLQ